MRKNRRPLQIPDGEVITLQDVYKSYAVGAPALNGISLHIRQGEFVFVVGDSGSGKSTLIKLLLRELNATKGEINVLGYDLNRIKQGKIPKFRRNLGIVFQDFRLLKDRNIYDNVAFAQRIIQVSSDNIKRNVPAILATVGLADKYKSRPEELSGGEQQRVALARAIVNKPLILLADEPTGNLDPHNSMEIMRLLERINNDGTTVIVVTHNLDIVNQMKKRVITMQQGIIVSDEAAPDAPRPAARPAYQAQPAYQAEPAYTEQPAYQPEAAYQEQPAYNDGYYEGGADSSAYAREGSDDGSIYDTSAFDTASYDTASYDTAAYDTETMERLDDQYDDAYYDEGAYIDED